MKVFSKLSAIMLVSAGLLLTLQPAGAFDFGKLKSKFEEIKQKTEELQEKKKQVDLVTGNVSQNDEIEIGRNVISGLLGAAPLVESVELQRYVNQVGSWVARQSERPDLPWTFGVIDSGNINAFAAPGGYIVVTLGLYELLENESQLAAVLAHEIGHVLEKHHLDAIRDSSQADILGSLAVRATDPAYRQKMERLVNAGVQVYARGLDQRFEFGADRMGVVLAARAGYDPYALLDVMATLHSIGASDDSMAVFLSTHPPLHDRMATLEQLMDQHMSNVAVPTTGDRLQRVNRKVATQIKR